VRKITARYYFAVRCVLKDKPELKNCLKRCVHCQIPFFTHRRNAKRSDLRCPFGCRDAHRRKKSTERSTAYYRFKKCKAKKKELNKRRRKKNSQPSGSDQEAQIQLRPPDQEQNSQPSGSVQQPPIQLREPGQEQSRQASGSVQQTECAPRHEINRATLRHVQIVIHLVDEHWMDLDVINDLIVKLRQHSIDFYGKSNYPCTRAP
jgi:hypothetical protein